MCMNGMAVPIKLVEKQVVGQIWPPGGSLLSSVLGLNGEHQGKAITKGQRRGPQRLRCPKGGWQSTSSSSLSLHRWR